MFQFNNVLPVPLGVDVTLKGGNSTTRNRAEINIFNRIKTAHEILREKKKKKQLVILILIAFDRLFKENKKLYRWTKSCLLRNSNHRLPPPVPSFFSSSFYRIHLKGYTGTAGKISSIGQPGSDFSTKDADNDKCVCKCSQLTTGGKKNISFSNYFSS